MQHLVLDTPVALGVEMALMQLSDLPTPKEGALEGCLFRVGCLAIVAVVAGGGWLVYGLWWLFHHVSIH